MKFSIIILLLVGFVGQMMAQELSKAEKKALKNEIRNSRRNLDDFAQMKAEDEELSRMIKSRQAQLSQLNFEMNGLQTQINERDGMIAKIQQDMKNTGRKLTAGNDGKLREVHFRVQIGAYRNAKLSRFLQKNANFMVEEDENGVKKYMMGNFNSYNEARNWCEKLVNKGASAYVVGYMNGERVQNLKLMPAEYLK
jgi:TolA-binding protein